MSEMRRWTAGALALAAWVAAAGGVHAQERFTRADTLRGTITPERAWWDLSYYDLTLVVNPADSTVSGRNVIHYAVTGTPREMQLDLQAPMRLDSVVQDGVRLQHRSEGDAHFVRVTGPASPGDAGSVTAHFSGRPRVAPMPPWDGGLVWAEDDAGRPWVGTAVQKTGASAFWPNKDHQGDEPDSARVRVVVPQGMVAVANGRLEETTTADGWTASTWFVTNPINNYNVTVNAGHYVHFGETYAGEDGALDLDYWVLEANLAAARRQFAQVPPLLACFESWFGPYPWYEDGFKMVETPYLGMEHQSAIAYGNRYMNGYLGQDLSGTGLGLSWDYIIVHEAAHEWWGNNVTTVDIADMWVHEGFGTYAEGVWVECQQGADAGSRYIRGLRSSVANDRPLIGPYGVNTPGSDDMYFKGANVLHTLRQVVNDDEEWREALRGIQEEFRHRTVTTAEIEAYMADRLDRDLSGFFEQYLRRTALPVLEYAVAGGRLSYRWVADAAGFDMPVRVTVAPGRFEWIEPVVGEWRTAEVALGGADFQVHPDFYVAVREGRPER